ncbi:hypothetical protein PS874_00337 [Pseudomonas fluorescens]|nr:hypothetical protein PS874_00337 [Pseudomonas fluorescens]
MPPSNGNNDKGFWEDIDFNLLNIELLKTLGHDWHTLTPVRPEEWTNPLLDNFKSQAKALVQQRFENTNCFGVKDPRMARTLPFWISIFESLELEVAYVIACRNPANAARSLVSRDGFELEKGYFLWHEHMLLSLKYSEYAARVFVDYDLLLQNPDKQMQRMARALKLHFDAEKRAVIEFKEHFLEKGLRHHKLDSDVLNVDKAAPAEVVELSELIASVASEVLDDGVEVKEKTASLYRDLFKKFPSYNLMRVYDDRATEFTRIISQKNLELKQKDENLVANDETLNQLLTKLDEQKLNGEQIKAKIEGYRVQLSSEQEKLKELHIVLDDQALHLHKNQETIAQYGSGRFLLKSLALLIARRARTYAPQSKAKLRANIVQMGLWSERYYLETYQDVKQAGLDPLEHYLSHGWKEGRNPSEAFSTQYYIDHYIDVRLAGASPLEHYVRYGYKEGRAIFDITGHIYQYNATAKKTNKLAGLIHLLINNPALIRRFIEEAKRSGIRQAIALAKSKIQQQQSLTENSEKMLSNRSWMEYGVYNVVPFNLNPYLHETPAIAPKKIAVHLHFFYEDMGDICVEYLNNIPTKYDLFVSVSPDKNITNIRTFFLEKLANANEVIVEHSQNRGRDVAPLIVQFGERLSNYDYFGHFHTKKSPHREDLNGWFSALMDTLCGDPKEIAQIFKLLEGDGKVVYASGNQVLPGDDGWSTNKDIAKDILNRFTSFNISDFPYVEFPQGTMFWAKSDCMREFLTLPLKFEDFPKEPILPDATLAHALERLLLIFSTKHPGRNYRIEAPQLSNVPRAYYEEQQDYSNSFTHNTIKVLAYYLPQFSPNPENDEWHGKGFTEWHKVRAANPLFHGHYQQHTPHSDIGYYQLDSHEQMAVQAAQMEKAGVHGMIFYHYWFSGKLILEKPAQMLLEHPEINMPFSFCWANENWTRRWDGNEQEILLGQVYSKEDASAFIKYLIPFFKDERYIKIDGRPVLFVYRPSAMEHVEEYMNIWAAECLSQGVGAPYVVATLTRGATAPQDYGMDAAVERVLQDWTGGAVPNISKQKHPYWPINGSILDYSSVADHYIEKELTNDYPLFRSLVPTWDNTARYGTEAFALDGFTTSKFQEWIEHLIDYSEQNLPEDRRFVVINAWNEWAEGAHLEPDTRFGYGYLNSVGRALSGYKFSETGYLSVEKNTAIHITLSSYAKNRLGAKSYVRDAFFQCIKNSSVFSVCTVSVSDKNLFEYLNANGVNCAFNTGSTTGLSLEFNDIYLFPKYTIESMIKMSLRHVGYNICASIRNDEKVSSDVKTNNAEIDFGERSGMILKIEEKNAGYKVCGSAPCFNLTYSGEQEAANPISITTIIRFHKQGDKKLLLNCLLSLISQEKCVVRPILAIQDIDTEELETLKCEISLLPWARGCFPEFQTYNSTNENPDLRSLMMNEALKSIHSGFATFLDYDDIVFPSAYKFLAERLSSTGKNATFGRVYSTLVDTETGLILARDKTYTYGYSYDDFVNVNHAPIHSFMLDVSKCNIPSVKYSADMKYMEDYYLTLQLFTREGTDWKSLEKDVFIGDYIHRVGSVNSNTLAVNDQVQRAALLASETYTRSEKLIKELRAEIIAAN